MRRAGVCSALPVGAGRGLCYTRLRNPPCGEAGLPSSQPRVLSLSPSLSFSLFSYSAASINP